MVVKAIQGKGAGGENIVERLKVPDGEYATAHARDGAAIQIAWWHMLDRDMHA
jgi:hypothetical protein